MKFRCLHRRRFRRRSSSSQKAITIPPFRITQELVLADGPGVCLIIPNDDTQKFTLCGDTFIFTALKRWIRYQELRCLLVAPVIFPML